MAEDQHEAPKVFDVRRVNLYIGEKKITGIAPAGFGITPSAETTIIMGLKGECGFSVDPSSAAEATLTLKSVSDSNDVLRDLLNKQQKALESTEPFAPFEFRVEVEAGYEKAFGFKSKKIKYAVITKWPEFATDEKNAPDYEWGFAGYGYEERSVGE